MIRFRLYFDKDKETKWLNEMAAKGLCLVFVKRQKPVVNNKYVQKRLPPPVSRISMIFFPVKRKIFAFIQAYFSILSTSESESSKSFETPSSCIVTP